ncbi:DUF342 domain-containing protein [Natronospira bacteriovora]|uniref:FapA family protein n=1 Tax=Natronospira bacteriovora TaxID=3069753 RepID=A0ABU0W2Y9_9GAMM|nr:FapA family protein [Natronospira sp. AB-CW4]MDQ2068374.1 FapA family protein [Natronospira sp. AB-CW4]
MDTDLLDKLNLEPDYESMQLFAASSAALPDISSETLQNTLESCGHGECELESERVLAFIAAARQGPTDPMPLGPIAHGEMKLDIADDGLTAWLTVTPPRGGRAVGEDAAIDSIWAEGVVHGVDKDAVRRIVRVADGIKHVIARGVPAQDGEDAWFQPLVADMVDRRPRIDDSERADFRELGGVITVQAGDPLIRRHPPTEGEPGTDVQGLPIPPRPGANKQFRGRMKGVRVDDGDPDLLIAAIDGQPIWKDDTVMVSPTLDLDQVDLSTGNIDFNGTVRVRGEVAYGMSVRASDDIQVGGLVEGASLSAGGDIVVRGGIIGQRRKGSDRFNAIVRCEGSLEARFLEHTQVICGTDVLVRDLVANCDIEAGEKIIVGARGTRKGHVMGGRYEAFEIIRAVQLGSPSGVETRLRVGNQFRLKKRIRQLTDRLRDPSLPPEMAEYTQMRQSELGETLAGLENHASIIAKDGVFTRVVMQIGAVTRNFTADAAGGAYRRRQNTIELDLSR